MEPERPDVVVPSEPGLHLLVDDPQGAATAALMGFASNALQAGVPVVPVLLDRAAPQFRNELSRHGIDVADAESRGLLQYVDGHAVRVGWAHTTPCTVFVEEAGPDALLLALAEAQAGVIEAAPEHLVLVDSFSTLLVLDGLPPTYAFAQSLASLAPRTGAVAVGRLVAGMHSVQDVTSLQHVATTVTDLRRAQPRAVDDATREWRR